MREALKTSDLKKAFRSALDQRKDVLKVSVLSISIYIVLTLSSFPQYSIEMLGASIFYLDEAFFALNANIFNTAGTLGITLSVVYSLVSGVFLLNFFRSIEINGFTGLKTGGSMFPAFIAGGCAGCGAGLLGFFGLLGIASALPFQGNGLKLGSILLLTASLAAIGDPETCRVQK